MHKPGDSMSNSVKKIVSNIKAPTYSLAKYLVKTFSFFRNFESLSIKNNIELVDKLSNFYFHNSDRLLSFDVIILFPSIWINITMQYFENWLDDLKIEDNKIKEFQKFSKIM